MKVDTSIVAAALAACEEMSEQLPDPNGIGASQLRIVVDTISGAIREQHPRFDAAEFRVTSLPIQTERQKQMILKALGMEDDAQQSV